MKTTDLIRHQLELSKNMTAGLLADMSDAQMTAPTPKGGNHPAWVAGHLVYSESNLVNHMLLGNENPLIEWKSLYGAGGNPTDDASLYVPMDEMLAKWDEVRAKTLSVLDGLTDEDLDKPSSNPPEGKEAFFDIYGKVFSIISLHPVMHRGQVADSRRAAGREPLMS